MKKRFFKEAKKESHLSDYKQHHLGAVAVYADKFILAKAHNTMKTNPTQYYYNKYRLDEKSNIMDKPCRSHAEIWVLRKIRFLDIDFSRVTIYIYRETKDGCPAMARPCASCEQMIRDLGICNVCYTAEGGFIEEKFYKE